MTPAKRKPIPGRAHPAPDPLRFGTPVAVPALYDGYVRRPDLVSRLRQASDYPLVLLSAPAGYAKTSVLSEWADQDDRPFAWVSLTSRDNDATRLLNRLVEAVDGVSLKGRPFVLVVDDADVLRTRGALDALANLIASLRPDGQIVLASRTEPNLPLGRMRAQREVFELTRRDLAMSRTESGALLEELGLKLGPEEVDAIHERIEGWPAALYLAGLSLAQEPGATSDVGGFAGDDQFVSDYFRDEFLARTSPARLRFLMRSSVLEDLAGQICDEVLQRSGSARVLRELSRSNLPLDPLDHSDGSYRYHPLFKQALAAELHRHEPKLEADLHRRASRWYAEHEKFEEAINHAMAAADQTRAAELIWARLGPSVATGNREAVRDWLDRFSDREVADSPELALCAAHLYLALGEGELGRHWASVADELFDEAPSDDPDLLADLLILRATLARDGIAQMDRDATRAGEHHPPDSAWRSISCFYAGTACQLRGDSGKARELLEEGSRRGAANAPLVQVFCLTQLTILHLDRDDLENALRVVAQAREQLNRFHLDVYPVMAFAFAASSLTRSREGRIEEAVADRKRAMELLEHLAGFPDWYLAETCIMLARASMNLDDAVRARSLLDEAAMFAARVHDGPTLGRWISESLASASSISSADDRAELTPAELRTLQFLPTHLSFREIAERSFVSPNTVKTQAQAIYRKLDASSRAEAVDQGREAGLLPDEPSAHTGQWPQP
jgi:LuxR family transcriptional regulator, maltose regulon positive regulatory protein